MRLVRHYDQEERETDGAVRWNTINLNISESMWRQKRSAKVFGKGLAPTHFVKEVTRRGSSIARSPNMYIRTHWWEHDSARTDGSRHYSTQLERVCTPQRLFFQHQLYLFAGGRESKEGRQTTFFTPLNPFWEY